MIESGETSTSHLNTNDNTSTRDSNENHFVISKCKRHPTVTPLRNDNNDNEDELEGEERLLTVCCRSGRLGAACYTLQTGELLILEEITDRAPEHQIFLSLFNQIEPVKIIMDGKSQGTLINAVKKIVFTDSNGGKCKLIFVSAKEYNFEACKRRIYSLSLPNEPPHCSDEERLVFLRTAIDFAQTQTVHALGAMLRYLDLNWSNLSMNLHGKPEFLNLKRISLNDIVSMDEDTYRGLQIFSSLSHPSGFKKGVQGSNKEGLSLFQIFSKCSSKVGHRRMRQFLRHPTKDIETLKRRQDVIAYFIRPQSDSIMRNICASLRFVKNVNGILAKIKALSAKAYQWKSLYNALYNVVLICEMCENAGQACEYLEQLATYDTNKLYEMALYMNRIIDFDLSKSEGKFTVKAGVDPDLDIKKQTMASLHRLMSETAKIELERLPTFIEECTMLYMPHLGYLLGVKAWDEKLTMEDKELPNMKFMFQNNDYIHYKSRGCEELDVMIGDTYPEIVAHETRIMMRLTSILLENLHALAAVIDKCAELDCLITISKVCKEYNYVRPTLTTDKVIDIKQGKDPLYITTCDNFVPNDVLCSREAGYVKILTGPNSSGKSVYMKQIGLIVYLAHIGSFVPAEAATVGVVSHIYSRIQSTECVAAHMSAFLIDLRQMSLALQESTTNSLIIIDEFGKGTTETDGLALLAACLNTLLFREDDCPHSLLATHFFNLKEYIVDTPIVNFWRFEYVQQGGAPVFQHRVARGAAPAAPTNTLPPANKKVTNKLQSMIEMMKTELLAADI
ncbi:mutS protein homolog 5-like [Nymphalis io]|uniref:mutS protein homolog 5-like n=1 Tax=Inachis io TaxID=171585 RepID=UPI0021683A6C|nr:mutS protein homolog 5-like [Nymphalis io]